MTRKTGTVKWFNRLKGWGFIDADDGREIFAHYQNIAGEGYRNLDDGDRVEFGVASNPNGKGQMAVDIRRMR